MNLLELLDRVMHTTPTTPTTPITGNQSSDGGPANPATQTRAQVDRTWRTLRDLDAAVAVAEARLRARGVQLPGDEDDRP